ncbi:tyrosine-type recombinase/integrase [Thalassospira alkalitolerans]|uniref:tyrosine-type recombinase/integrase n=1 Tax=Thalassospira alkalitolerans TaxID=1293890 RepID=UPI003AA81BC2
MVTIRLKGIKRVKAKGRWYFYHRATGKRIAAKPNTAAFAAEVAQLDEQAASIDAKTGTIKGTWGWLVENYRKSPEWLALADRTKKDYMRVFDYMERVKNEQLDTFTPPKMARLRDLTFQNRKRHFANYTIAVISLCWNWGKVKFELGPNPTDGVKGIKKPKSEPEVNRPWTADELKTVLAFAPEHLRTVIALGAFTGLREGDVVRLPWSSYDGSAININQGKTNEPHWVPVQDVLKAILDVTPRKGTIICVNTRGKSWTGSGFRTSFRNQVILPLREAGQIGERLTFHGLRHTVGTALADAGADTRTIMAVLGHKTSAMSEKYSKHADRRKRASAGIKLLEGK